MIKRLLNEFTPEKYYPLSLQTYHVNDSLIFEKCKPFEDTTYVNKISNEYNPRNWGVKYEPVSTMIYSFKHPNTTLKTDYGCIPHSNYPFIGASPDGINISPECPEKYGCMVEIKNIFNREITGIPLEEYWIQMQIQMETCRLEYCDFLETRFKEYSKEEYDDDRESEYKGIMLFFIPKENTTVQSHFSYVPLFIENEDEWIDNKVMEMNSHILYTKTYWYLDEYFCTEIERNEMWFRASVPKMIDGWETVLKERESGYEHRAPQSRKKKSNSFVHENETSMVTIIKLDERGCELSV
jgi:hypothetical protein